jgi:hypothetical protein
MISHRQLSTLSFMAALERLGAIPTAWPVAQTLAVMRERPQELLVPMAIGRETALMTLFRLHHQGFERDRRPIWWEETPATRTLLNKVRREFGKQEKPTAEGIVGFYFSNLARMIEQGGRFLLSQTSWHESYVEGFVAEARSHDDPEARAANLARMAVNLASHGFVQRAEGFMAEASNHAVQIPDEGTRLFCEDRLALSMAEAGFVGKAREYFQNRIQEVMNDREGLEGKIYRLKDILACLIEAGFTDLFGHALRQALDITQYVPAGSGRDELRLGLLGMEGYVGNSRKAINQIIRVVRSRGNAQELARFAFLLEDSVRVWNTDLRRLHSALWGEAMSIARGVPSDEQRARILSTIAGYACNDPKLSRNIFKEALQSARKIQNSKERMAVLREIEEEASFLERPLSLPELDPN